MLKKTKEVLAEIKGTASELRDNSNYNELEDKIGEEGALRLIKNKLEERNLTTKEFVCYRKVRQALHKNPLNVHENIKEIDDLANNILDA